jgi:cysteine synthase
VLDRLLVGADEFVYASPAYGYAQVALAYACAARGLRATVFTAKRKALHARTLEAKAAGAKIVLVPTGYLSNVQAKARAYAAAAGAALLPFGFDTAEFCSAIADVARALPMTPAEVWTVAGSGTLTRALQQAWPGAVFHAVQVGREPRAGRARVYVAPEQFEDNAKERPPFPSCSNYDAKAWRFIRAHAQPGALFWNVAA